MSFVKHAAHTLPFPDDPEAGGPDPACGSEADGPETGGSAAGVPASGLCFFVGGRVAEDELSDDEEDGRR